eukprot:gene8326-2849_t
MAKKAVIFDVGGVLVESPFPKLRRYAELVGLPKDFFFMSVKAGGDNGAFQQLERGQLRAREFGRAFEVPQKDDAIPSAMQDIATAVSDFSINVPERARPLDGQVFLEIINSSKLRQEMWDLVAALKQNSDLKVGVITNNWENDVSDYDLFKSLTG